EGKAKKKLVFRAPGKAKSLANMKPAPGDSPEDQVNLADVVVGNGPVDGANAVGRPDDSPVEAKGLEQPSSLPQHPGEAEPDGRGERMAAKGIGDPPCLLEEHFRSIKVVEPVVDDRAIEERPQDGRLVPPPASYFFHFLKRAQGLGVA